MSEQQAAKQPHPQPQKPSPYWSLLTGLFETVHWLTEKVMGILRLFATIALFSVVTFVIYSAWVSRNTVAVKPFQVPVAIGKNNHEHAGRIIANLLNQHLLDEQNNLQAVLNREIEISRPVTAEDQILLEGESIKLPETGITIDNVIEFISGVFGRKNLNGSVYFEPDPQDPKKNILHLQITLKGRIISYNENALGEKIRSTLPPTQDHGLNIQLISTMLKAHAKDIISIASEDYNLYYYCTQGVDHIEHDAGEHKPFFGYCSQLRDQNVTPTSLTRLREQIDQHNDEEYRKSIVATVLTYLKEESKKKLATLCQSAVNQSHDACQNTQLAQATIPPSLPNLDLGKVTEALTPIIPESAQISYTLGNNHFIEKIQPKMEAIPIASLEALEARCQADNLMVAENKQNIITPLEQQCFGSPQMQKNTVASPDASRKSMILENEATQLLHNGLYSESLRKYHEAILQNCNNAIAWANMGILLSTATSESQQRDVKQAQCALLHATRLDDNDRGWIRHSLCVAQALEGTSKLENYLGFESCQQARQLEPINVALYDKLFFIDIANHYRELGKPKQAIDAYLQSMSNETTRSCHMKTVFNALVDLAKNDLPEAKRQACELVQGTAVSVKQTAPGECETELETLVEQQCEG